MNNKAPGVNTLRALIIFVYSRKGSTVFYIGERYPHPKSVGNHRKRVDSYVIFPSFYSPDVVKGNAGQLFHLPEAKPFCLASHADALSNIFASFLRYLCLHFAVIFRLLELSAIYGCHAVFLAEHFGKFIFPSCASNSVCLLFGAASKFLYSGGDV